MNDRDREVGRGVKEVFQVGQWIAAEWVGGGVRGYGLE